MSRYHGWYFPRSTPRQAEGGIVARKRSGGFAENWWAQKWIDALESFGWSNRLQRGRSYARRGQVLDFELGAGVVKAKVQGSRPKPYAVTIKVAALSDADWRKAVQALASKAAFSAKLLAGEMPADIEEAFTDAKLSLLPQKGKDLITDCSCPDWANPCKHIAATYYIIGEEFDRDPFLIFELRGRDREQLLTELRKLWSGDAGTSQDALLDTAETLPLSAEENDYWGTANLLESFRVRIAAPPVPAAVIRRLGEPSFWRGEEDFTSLMQQMYETVTRHLLKEAFEEE